MFDLTTKISPSFLALIRKNINDKYSFSKNTSIEITGPIEGTLFFVAPPEDKKVKFVIKKNELTHVAPGVEMVLPEEMYFV